MMVLGKMHFWAFRADMNVDGEGGEEGGSHDGEKQSDPPGFV